MLAVAAAVALGWAWDRGNCRSRLLYRPALLALCLISAAATGLVWLNRQVDTYPTWASLVGAKAAAAEAVPVHDRPGGGRILSLTVAGAASGLTMPMYVYLPADAEQHGERRYPVIEALHGYPGSPLQWLNKLGAAEILDREIASGRMAPTVVLFPYQTPRPSLDTECTNLVGGPQTETFLTVDVPAFAKTRLPVRTGPGTWGLIGYSAGGYCATSLLLRHPGQYAAAASLSGYSGPGIAVGDGSEHTTYDNAWRLRHLPVPAVALYLASARTDRAAMRGTTAIADLVRAPMSVTTAFVRTGGHNAGTWRAMEPPAFAWLSQHLARPTTP
ncbi:putative esterase [Actinoplanes missouriensis 431]|uniref:Putative esterase n=1 Tax=Actinoplanes missouriensis (strain ATCC 14538 / DSM 43046 / CBS 188.64 / JCM 3121 / NBRC 102363 / NCIMB 12654 / NRRL B-3342 / UNCC 431) TaxID=512565 RepID=I0H4I1_ACTM4|nr:putative esterase [Actinoplanes missouriensis 431]